VIIVKKQRYSCKKTEVKKLKNTLYVRPKKKVDPKGYRVIKLYKKYEILKKNPVFLRI
jgi:hypothetical protein